MDARLEEACRIAAKWLRQADGLLITAGAGMGVDSGLPDFRGNQGFWNAYPVLGLRGISFVDAANPRTFALDPHLAWGFYGHRLLLYRDTVPHEGFALLKELGAHYKRGYFVFTSNVDGQFQRAGFDETRIVECHGSIHQMQCCRPCEPHLWSTETWVPEVDEAECRLTSGLPRCATCGGVARPSILMFGDTAWIESRTDKQHARYRTWRATVSQPVVIELGAGTAIPSVRHFGEREGNQLIRINPALETTNRDDVVHLQVGALAGIRAIVGAFGTN